MGLREHSFLEAHRRTALARLPNTFSMRPMASIPDRLVNRAPIDPISFGFGRPYLPQLSTIGTQTGTLYPFQGMLLPVHRDALATTAGYALLAQRYLPKSSMSSVSV